MAATWIFIMQSMRTAQATPEKQKLHNTSSYGGIGVLCPLFRGERDCSDIMINGNIFTNNRFGEHIGINKIWVTDGKTFLTMIRCLLFDWKRKTEKYILLNLKRQLNLVFFLAENFTWLFPLSNPDLPVWRLMLMMFRLKVGERLIPLLNTYQGQVGHRRLTQANLYTSSKTLA